MFQNVLRKNSICRSLLVACCAIWADIGIVAVLSNEKDNPVVGHAAWRECGGIHEGDSLLSHKILVTIT